MYIARATSNLGRAMLATAGSIDCSAGASIFLQPETVSCPEILGSEDFQSPTVPSSAFHGEV